MSEIYACQMQKYPELPEKNALEWVSKTMEDNMFTKKYVRDNHIVWAERDFSTEIIFDKETNESVFFVENKIFRRLEYKDNLFLYAANFGQILLEIGIK